MIMSLSFSFDVNGDLLDEETVELLSEGARRFIPFNIDIELPMPVIAAAGRKKNIYQLMYNVSKLCRTAR